MEEEKEHIINYIVQNQEIISMVRDRYRKYKTNDSYFYVPLTAIVNENKSLKIDVGDKSYNNINELTLAVKAWSENKLKNIDPFVKNLWENKNKNINVLILVDTDEYTFGAYVRIG